MNGYEALRERTKRFAVDVVKMIDGLPGGRSIEVLSKQLLRAATSVGANYRGACRARSKAEFIAKMHIVQEESDETQYWMELLYSTGALNERSYLDLQSEARELTAIFTASEATARSNLKKR